MEKQKEPCQTCGGLTTLCKACGGELGFVKIDLIYYSYSSKEQGIFLYRCKNSHCKKEVTFTYTGGQKKPDIVGDCPKHCYEDEKEIVEIKKDEEKKEQKCDACGGLNTVCKNCGGFLGWINFIQTHSSDYMRPDEGFSLYRCKNKKCKKEIQFGWVEEQEKDYVGVGDCPKCCLGKPVQK